MTGLLAVGAIGILPAYAEDSTTYAPIVQKLADRFGLNVEDVEEVFDEERAERHAEMLQSFEDRLSEAVTNGKITEEQKQLILDKHEEMQAKMKELKSQDLTREEMQEEMKTYHEELKAWADEQNIDLPLFGFGKGFGRGLKAGGPDGEGFMMGMH